MISKSKTNFREPAPEQTEWDPRDTLRGYEVEEWDFEEHLVLCDGGRIVLKRRNEGEDAA